MNKVDGLHHLAICTADMKRQIEFFTDKLGMELVALYWMHGVANTWHGFLRLNDESSIAFVSNPAIGEIPHVLGQTHAGNPGAGALAGIGFTMSLFIAGQAFPVTVDFAAAKVAVFAASIVSAVIGLALLARAARPGAAVRESRV
jgi:catechol 2,3-dioxygenase-like lactoylglutathione lyase family enzyme